MEYKTLKIIIIGISCLILSFSLTGKTEAQCADWGEGCGELVGVNCCAGWTCIYFAPKIGTCCNPGLAGNRGVSCKCEEDCRVALTCTGGTCCDDRAATKRDAGIACYCDVECNSGQCIGGVCFDPAAGDTCSPAGCACIDTGINCERILGGEVNSGLTCPDPTLNVCCCPLESSSCESPCSCQRICHGLVAGPCEDSGYWCCCPRPEPPPAVCGNNILEAGEQCDDGNTVSGDGCSSTCLSEGGNGNGNGDNGWPIGGNGGIIDLQSPLGCTTIEECIGRMINFLFSLSVILAPLMIIIAGFLYITAAGKPEKIVQAQKLITWTLIGFLIVSLARAIIYVIANVIGG